MINAMTAIITMAFSHVVTFVFDYHQASDLNQWSITMTMISEQYKDQGDNYDDWCDDCHDYPAHSAAGICFWLSSRNRIKEQWPLITINQIKEKFGVKYKIYDWSGEACQDDCSATQLLLFGPPPPPLVHLDKESQTHSIQTLPISPPKWQPVLKFLRGNWNFCKYSSGNSYLAHLHRCRRGGGGEQLYFCSSHQTKPGRKLSSGFNVARSSSLRSGFESAPGALPLSRLGAWGSAHDGLAPVLHVLQAPYNFWGSSMWTTHLNQVGKH